MDWLHPGYTWTLLAVPLVVTLLWWAFRARRLTFRRFGDTALLKQLAMTVGRRWRLASAALVVLAVLLLAVSLMGPRYGTRVREVERRGVDLIIALDVSQSMQAEDVAPNRLERAKNEIKKLLGELTGDRVGLVVFAGDGFVQCPLTTDYNAIRLFLDVAEPDLIPTPGTSYQAAFNAAVLAFESSTIDAHTGADVPDVEQPPEAFRSRALLIVSDGENHVGNIGEVKQEARDRGIVLYAAGVGEREGAPIPLYENGRQRGYKRDSQGEVVTTKLEEGPLTSLAESGAYFRIARTSSALPDLKGSLTRLEQTTFDAERFEEYEEVFQWPLALAVVLLVAERFMRVRRRPTLTV